MNENENNGNAFHLPRKSEVVPIIKKSHVTDIKPAIERALADDIVVEKIEAFITNGGREGHKLFDNERAMEVVTEYDDKHGGAGIRASGLNTLERVAQFNVVARRHWLLDKKGKAVNVNPKRYKLIEHKKPDDTAAAE